MKVGSHHTEEWKKLLSLKLKEKYRNGWKTNKGKKFPQDLYPNFGFRNKHLPKEMKDKIGEASRRNWQNQEFRKVRSEEMKILWQNPEFKGHRKFSKETIDKIREARLNQIFSEESKRLRTESTKAYWKSQEGIEERKKRSIEWLTNGNPNFGKHLNENTKKKLRLSRLNQILPVKDTSIEVKIQEALTKLNISFTTHKTLISHTQCDIFIEPNIVIFADGCWWHGCEKCFDMNKFLNSGLGKSILARQITDKAITMKLIDEGFKVLRFWEHDINENFEDLVLDKIIFLVNETKRGVEI